MIESLPTKDDLRAMSVALTEARAALAHGDVPVGAVVMRDGEVISRRHNERELSNDPTAHAELLAIRDAANVLQSWRLDGCTLVVSLEPCVMCAGSIWSARVPRLVFGAADPKAGATGTLYNIATDTRLNHQSDVIRGVMAQESTDLLKNFFQSHRNGPSDSAGR